MNNYEVRLNLIVVVQAEDDEEALKKVFQNLTKGVYSEDNVYSKIAIELNN